MKQCVCPAGRPSRGPARQPGHFSCFAKRSNQEKATPEMAVRYADSPRPQHRKREASETRYAQTADASLSVSGTGDAAPSTGIHCNRNRNRNRNGNCRYAERQGQLSLRGTSRTTATVATRNVKDNRNCRYAERQGQLQLQPQRSLRGATSNGNCRCADNESCSACLKPLSG